MSKQKTGWKGESARHSAARKGIKTTLTSNGIFNQKKKNGENISITKYSSKLGRLSIYNKYTIESELRTIIIENLKFNKIIGKYDSININECQYEYDFKKGIVKIKIFGVLQKDAYCPMGYNTDGLLKSDIILSITDSDVDELGGLTYNYTIKDIKYSYTKEKYSWDDNYKW